MLMSAKDSGDEVYKKVLFRHTFEAGPKKGEVVQPIPNTPRPDARRTSSKTSHEECVKPWEECWGETGCQSAYCELVSEG